MEENMKTRKILFFLFVFGITFFGCNGNESNGVFAQSSNNEQRLIGTWINNSNRSTVTFNSDGSMSGISTMAPISGSNWRHDAVRYAVAGDKIVIYFRYEDRESTIVTDGGDFRISNDGQTLIIILNNRGIYSFRKN